MSVIVRVNLINSSGHRESRNIGIMNVPFEDFALTIFLTCNFNKQVVNISVKFF